MNALTLPQHKASRGFSLIELLIVVTLMGIITAIALPSYTAHISRSRRAEARTSLLQAAQFLQRFYAANDAFDADRAGNAVLTQMPDNIKKSPPDGTAHYQLNTAITSPGTYAATISPGAYTLTMAPVSGGAMVSDVCGRYLITSTGIRGNLAADGSALPTQQREYCWK